MSQTDFEAFNTSIAAFVVGLMTSHEKISYSCGRLTAGRKSGSKEINDIKTAVDTLRSVLLQVKENSVGSEADIFE